MNKAHNIRTSDVLVSIIKMDVYQRKIDNDKVSRICKNFNPHRMRPIELSYRDGNYYCFDGQNRVEAYKRMGLLKIPANIHFGLTREDECILFADQNVNEVRVPIRDKWKARVIGKDEKAMVITKCCNEYGLEVGDKSGSKTVGAVRELEKIVEEHGEQGLKDALFVLRTAFQSSPGVVHHDMIAGMRKIMDTYPSRLGDYEYNRMVDRLSKITPAQLLKEANTERGRGGKQTAMAIIRRYNSGLPHGSKKRLNEHLIH